MTPDFMAQQEAIKGYVEAHLPDVISRAGLCDLDAYIDDFLDFDRYRKRRQLFYGFSYYEFDGLTNQSGKEDFEFSVYLAFSGDSPGSLRKDMLGYAAAFWRMFEEGGGTFGGIADFGTISTVRFYPAAEGHRDLKIAELTIRLETER